MKKVIEFLLGESDLDGYYFGESPKRKPFFWRTYLRAEWEKQQVRISELEQRESELSATVERLREALNQSLISWGYVGVPDEEGATYKECEKRLEETPQQNLSTVKRDAIEEFKNELVKSVNVMFRPHIEGVAAVVSERYANTIYPSDKDGE